MNALLVGPNGPNSCLGQLSSAYHLEMTAHFPAPSPALMAYLQVEPRAPEALIVDLSALADPHLDQALIRLLDASTQRWPGCRVAVVLGDAQQYLLDQIQHASARVFRPEPSGNGATGACRAVAAYLGLPRRRGERARTLLVLSAKGGVGKTTLIANLATALVVRHGLRVAVVDGDLTRGDLAHLLGVQAPGTLMDLVADRSAEGIRRSLDRYLVHLHGGALALLCAPGGSSGSGQPWTALTPRHAQAILAALGDRYDLVLLDTPPDVQRSSPFPAAVVDAAAPFLALVVIQPQPLERRGARQVLDLLAARPVPQGQVRGVLINRYRARGNPARLAGQLGVEITAVIPYDPRAATARRAADLVYDFGSRRLRGAARAYAELAAGIAREGQDA